MPNEDVALTRILAVGDVVGRPGRESFRKLYPVIRSREEIDFCIVNAENAAGGSGITPSAADELLGSGADVLTSGDHVWRKREVAELFGTERRLLRPANFPPGAPGRGSLVAGLPGGGKIAVISLLGRVFMEPVDCPFRALESELALLAGKADVIVVDFHAEATSEKAALARHFAGRVSAVVGTHTHVPTADERILSGGTGFITDIGMCGSLDSILGRDPSPVIERLRTCRPIRFPVCSVDPGLQGVILECDRKSGRTVALRRLELRLEEEF